MEGGEHGRSGPRIPVLQQHHVIDQIVVECIANLWRQQNLRLANDQRPERSVRSLHADVRVPPMRAGIVGLDRVPEGRVR